MLSLGSQEGEIVNEEGGGGKEGGTTWITIAVFVVGERFIGGENHVDVMRYNVLLFSLTPVK